MYVSMGPVGSCHEVVIIIIISIIIIILISPSDRTRIFSTCDRCAAGPQGIIIIIIIILISPSNRTRIFPLAIDVQPAHKASSSSSSSS